MQISLTVEARVDKALTDQMQNHLQDNSGEPTDDSALPRNTEQFYNR